MTPEEEGHCEETAGLTRGDKAIFTGEANGR